MGGREGKEGVGDVRDQRLEETEKGRQIFLRGIHSIASGG